MPTSLTKPPLTAARLSFGRDAPTIATADHLNFQLDHALARDAVHAELHTRILADGLRAHHLNPILLHSAIDPGPNARRTYLRRPDLGRILHPASQQVLQDWATQNPPSERDHPRVAIILADGLSALALERHALPLLYAVLPLILNPCSLTPVLNNARVALADPIGHLLGADLTLLLIGERPGLSSPDSLGVYLTWQPRPGRTDAERNCISNIRPPAGLSYTEAAHRIAHYLTEATRLKTTGTLLKDPTPARLSRPELDASSI